MLLSRPVGFLHLHGAAAKQGHPHTLQLLWFAQPAAKEIREKNRKYWSEVMGKDEFVIGCSIEGV